MATQTVVVIGLTMIVTSYRVQAFSAGAPTSSCLDLIPGHQGSFPNSTGYQFSANISKSTYCTGDQIHIEIGSPEGGNRFFKGFLCQARASLDGMTLLGNLVSNNTYSTVKNCNTTASVTHASSDPKTHIRLVWTPAPGMTSAIVINCTIVIDFTTYVANVTKKISYGNQQCQSGNGLTGSPSPTPSFLTPTFYWDTTVPVPCECPYVEEPVNGKFEVSIDEIMSILFTCNVGHLFEFPPITGNTYKVYCLCGNWSDFTNVSCKTIDCGGNFILDNGYVYSGDGTTFGAAIVIICNTGYELIGASSAVCMANGQWSNRIPYCLLVECSFPRIPGNGSITNPQINTTFGSVVTYKCDSGFVLEGHEKIRCLSTGFWSGPAPLCIRVPTEEKPNRCDTGHDYRGTLWEHTSPGVVASKPCLKGFHGEISRKCTLEGQWLLPVYNCIRESLEEVTKLVEGAIENPSETVVSSILSNLTHVSDTNVDDALYDTELKIVTTILESIVALSENLTIDDDQKQSRLYTKYHLDGIFKENFIKTASNLVDRKNVDSWRAVNQQATEGTYFGPAEVLRAVDEYSEVVANSSTNETEIRESNIVFRVINNNKENIRFPTPNLATELRTSTFYFLSNISLSDNKDEQIDQLVLKVLSSVLGVRRYSSVFYKNLTEILPTFSISNSSSLEINGAVLSLNLLPPKEDLESSLQLNFQHFNTFYRNPVCSFWNFQSNDWDTEGCDMVSTNSEVTKCTCSHLTNFAILMSPYKQEVSKALNIVSTIGSGISLFGLVLTVVLHVTFWRHVKSERALLVVCLSASLIIFYAIFIVGVEKTENKDVCTAVAVSLHFSLLVVFFLMLALSTHIAISIIYVFRTKVKNVKWLIPMAIGIPLLIVVISTSITKTNGYGTDDYCWLSSDNGLFWAFIGPALFVLCVNIIILILIVKKMHSTKMMMQKSGTDKIKSTVKCLCVLLPVMGVTWMIGLFYINDDTKWIQYIFATVNSLQGLVIFAFHCALNRQIQRAIILTKRKYSVGTSESRLENELKKIKTRESFDKVEAC